MIGNITSIRRQVKNVAYNFTDAQVKVREATSNDPWGPSSSMMSEIADMTYNTMAFAEIMQMIWKRLNDHGKNWRHVYKSLVLLDYLIKVGSDRVAQQCRENIYSIQTLRDFQHIEENKDQGMNVREKAKQLVNLLKDDERLKNERARALMARKRFAQNGMGIGSDGTTNSFRRSDTYYGDDDYEAAGMSSVDGVAMRQRRKSELEECRPSSMGEEELQLQIALALSKEEAAKDEEQRKRDDLRLQLAISESSRHTDKRHSLDSSHSPMASARRTNGQQQQRSAIDDLLSLQPAFGGGGLHSSDPFATPRGAAARSASAAMDPWGGSGAGVSPNSTAMNDPWAATNNHTTTTQGVQRADTGFLLDSQLSTGSGALQLGDAYSPLGGTGVPQVGGFFADPWAMDTLRSTIPDAHMSPLGADDIFIGGLNDGNAGGATGGNALRATTKTPEHFLGQNSSLVNLDNLMGPAARTNVPGMPPTRAAVVNNPFASTSSAFGTSATPNPFSAPNRPSPTLNEIRGGGQPASMMAPGVLQPQPSWQQQPAAPQSPTNPFL